MILSVYAANERALKYVKQKLIGLKRKIDKSIIILGNYDTSLFVINGTRKQKISTIHKTGTAVYQLGLINTEQFTQQEQNIHSFQGHMKYSPA